MSGGEGEGVLITGVYGAGKSSVAEEIADALEARGARFGAVDLDWLMWFGVPGVEPENLRRVFLADLAAVVGNYRDAGVIHFVLPGGARSRRGRRAGGSRRDAAASGSPCRISRASRPPSDVRPDQRPARRSSDCTRMADRGRGRGHRRSGGHERRFDSGSGNRDSGVALLVDPRGHTSGEHPVGRPSTMRSQQPSLPRVGPVSGALAISTSLV